MTRYSELRFEIRPNPRPASAARRNQLIADPGFGQVFTDHMASIQYSDKRGWYEPRIEAHAPITINPASGALHYGQAIFEGLKAYAAPEGGVNLFRPIDNARRFNLSAKRIAMPELSEELFLESLSRLIEIDRDWIPRSEDRSLYLRPFMFASEPFLSIRPATEYRYLVIASPASSYFSRGVRPLAVWVSRDSSRAAPGGTGAAKFAGNYAASLIAQKEAAENGCDQVVFLDAAERRYIEEMGGMNIFFVRGDGVLITPPLSGTILPGITRDTVLRLACRFGLKTLEQPITIEEWKADATTGRLREAFACGTAAVITPIGRVRTVDGEFVMGDGSPGEVSTKLRRTLLDLQHGQIADENGWIHRVL